MRKASFRWGVLGTGLAARKFVLGLRASASAEAVAIGSRAAERAQAFARDFGIPRAYGSYEGAVGDAEVDAFYVATPPSLHRDHALLCLGAGRPVLVEKPFTVTAREARDVVEAARARALFCMEGLWTRFHPLVRRAKRMIDAGDAGEPRLLTASFGLPEVVDARSGLFRPELGGGALLDRGVYAISLACHFLGRPAAVVADAAFGETGVDEDVAVTLRHRDGALALLHASLRTACANDLVIMGTRARIRLQPPIYRPFRMTVTPIAPRARETPAPASREALRESGLVHGAFQRLSRVAAAVRDRHARDHVERYGGNGYHHEADEVARCVREGRLESDVMPLAESIAVMETIEAARACFAGAGTRPGPPAAARDDATVAPRVAG